MLYDHVGIWETKAQKDG